MGYECRSLQSVRVKIILVIESGGAEDERREDGAEGRAEGCRKSAPTFNVLLRSHGNA